MDMQSAEITIPDVRLNIDQLLAVIRHLDKPSRVQVAKVLAETDLDAELDDLIVRLAAVEEKNISDADIAKEIQAVRQKHRQTAVQ